VPPVGESGDGPAAVEDEVVLQAEEDSNLRGISICNTPSCVEMCAGLGLHGRSMGKLSDWQV
jgi:hypothetical protein